MSNLELLEIDYHRNGSYCEGFFVARFKENDRIMLVTMFKWNEDDRLVSVLDVTVAAETIKFGKNSWRGDRYSFAMIEAIEDFYAKNGWDR